MAAVQAGLALNSSFPPDNLRSAFRDTSATGYRIDNPGFRVGRTLIHLFTPPNNDSAGLGPIGYHWENRNGQSESRP